MCIMYLCVPTFIYRDLFMCTYTYIHTYINNDKQQMNVRT